MMTNMKTVLFTDESRASPNDGLTKGWVFNGDIMLWEYSVNKSGSMIMIWGEMIGNELTGLFRVPEELNCPLTCIARS